METAAAVESLQRLMWKFQPSAWLFVRLWKREDTDNYFLVHILALMCTMQRTVSNSLELWVHELI